MSDGKVAFRTQRAAILIGLAALIMFGAAGFSAFRSDQAATRSGENAEVLRDVIRSTKRIETIVTPVCITPGKERECEKLLIAADEARVADLCRRTASVLRKAGIEAHCVVVRPPERAVAGDGTTAIPPPPAESTSTTSNGSAPAFTPPSDHSSREPEPGESDPPLEPRPERPDRPPRSCDVSAAGVCVRVPGLPDLGGP